MTLMIVALVFAFVAGFFLGFGACALGMIREKARLAQERETMRQNRKSKQEDKKL